mmetsp:Transcript_26255/g.40440  ORF Transcript_26255/g.40440 Transcript_26255/m.40440 type:complete len:130 (+) Transcript_26255:107-496(+)
MMRTFFKQIIDGVDFMHQNNIAHRDLKLENILVDEETNLKLADFGFAKNMEEEQTKTKLGTNGYKAPELQEQYGMQNSMHSKKYDGKAVDIFTTGVILYMIVLGRPPFKNADKTCAWWNLFQKDKDKYW